MRELSFINTVCARFLFLLFAFFVLYGAVAKAESLEEVADVNRSDAVVDVASVTQEDNIAMNMLGFGFEGEGDLSIEQALESDGWNKVGQYEDILERPRQHSTLWLKARLENSSDKYVKRWFDLSPWRLNKVDAWFLDPESGEIRKKIETGLQVPLEEREVKKKRLILPVEVQPDESLQMVIRVYSDSRPFLDIASWDPVELSLEEMESRQFHSLLFVSILTLFVVLLLKLDARYALLGFWILIVFVLESEKEGYVSQVLLTWLFDYSANLRTFSWILSESLFLVASVSLLRLRGKRFWLSPFSLLVTIVFGVVTFFLDGVLMRNMGIVIHFSFSIAWLFMVPAAFRVNRQWHYALLGVLSLWWLVSNFFLIGYATNFYYTASFAELRIYSAIFMILCLLVFYSQQKRSQEKNLEEKLRRNERDKREELEKLVRQRTKELSVALDGAKKVNEEKNLFLGRISHDLKSPLTSISGYAQLLSAEDGQIGMFGRIIYSSSGHMNNLINRLIGYARGVASHEWRDADVHLEELFYFISREADILVKKNDNHFFMDVSVNDFPIVMCDEVSLRQVAINLIDNSAKHTFSGEVSLIVSCYELNDGSDRVGLDMTVKDTGRGISEELQERVFQPFSRDSQQGSGAGLGLAIVKDLVTTMGGDVTLDSEQGVGTEVNVLIPVEIGEEAGVIRDSAPTPDWLMPKYHVDNLNAWVVEDSKPILELLCRDMDAMGFVVKGFQSGHGAISALNDSVESPDVIVTDYRLQGVSGDDVLRAARARDATVPVMLVSATWSVLRSRRHQDSLLEYSAYLSKPIDFLEFRREVARIYGLETADGQNVPENGVSEVAGEPPDPKELETFLELGAVSDIMDWCDALAFADPGQKELADRLRSQAERGNFSEIRKLTETLT